MVALLVLFVNLYTPASAQTSGQSPVKMLVLGDSLVAGYNMPARDAFPAQLERRLKAEGYNLRVINAGVSGDTTAGALARLNWLLGPDKPQFALVALGANDMLRGVDPAQTYANLDAILTRLAQEKVQVILAGMLAPSNYGADYAKEFTTVYTQLADKHKVAFYPFFLEKVAGQKDLNQADGMHPNQAGVAVMVEGILPTVKLGLQGLR